jgi:hypothetical protein
MQREEFASRRRTRQDEAIEALLPIIREALENYDSKRGWWRPVRARVRKLFTEILQEDSGGEVRTDVRAWGHLSRWIEGALPKTGEPTEHTAEVIATWLSVAAINAAATAAAKHDPEPLLLEWVTMHDNKVREAHAETDGQQRPPGELYDVGGFGMQFPGDPRAPIELWINCRCVLRPLLLDTAVVKAEPMSGGDMSTETVEREAAPETEAQPVAPMAWHGVLAPEGVWSGDGRRFEADSLRHRDLPLPLTWQRASDDGHKGSVVVGRIDRIERADGLMHSGGVFLDNPEADELIGLLGEFGRFGVSVDADDSAYELDEESGRVSFTSARIASASVVAIPAFMEAFIALGNGADESELSETESAAGATITTFVSDTPWSRFDASDYTDEQWYRACVLHRNGNSRTKSDNGLPIREPSGTLNRNGVHAAAARFNQVDAPPEAKTAAARALRGAYKQLGEDVPDALNAANISTVPFGRGPGWITNPRETKRLHDYWTKPGEPGYAKVDWGTPGDFQRCRSLIGEEIAENSPEDVRYLNQICAQWHHDATGYWPGRAPTEQSLGLEGDPAPALTLVASTPKRYPSSWFKDPHLDSLTPLSISEDGQVFGHLCGWETCHVGYGSTCVTPPHSASSYAHFLTGEVLTDDGGSVPVGQITLGGGHADSRSSAKAAMAHYDSTSAAVVDVSAGEDEHGIWLAGHLRDGVTDAQVEALRASALSGDWRTIGGNLELIAALAVNSPGFSVPRVRVAASSGTQVSLVAAGAMHVTQPEVSFDMDQFTETIALALEQRAARRAHMAALAERVGSR